jgi:hypothetical protein
LRLRQLLHGVIARTWKRNWLAAVRQPFLFAAALGDTMQTLLSILFGVLVVAGTEALLRAIFTWEWFLNVGKRKRPLE